MKYSKNQISEMLENLRPSSNNESAYSMSHLAASRTSPFCANPGGEDLFTVGCEDARYF